MIFSKKEYTDEERYNIAATLEGLIGLDDVSAKEEQAIFDAIRLVCPEYADSIEHDAEDFAEAWDKGEI